MTADSPIENPCPTKFLTVVNPNQIPRHNVTATLAEMIDQLFCPKARILLSIKIIVGCFVNYLYNT
jgi:hypothetical protein